MNELAGLPSVIDLSSKPNKMKLFPQKIKRVIEPQIEIITGDTPLLISHREIDDNDFYWLANNSGVKQLTTLSLRDGTGAAELWNCETGEIETTSYKRVGARNQIELEFDPYEAYWLVFDSSKEPVFVEKLKPLDLNEVKINEPWKIRYPETKQVKVTSARSFIAGDAVTRPEFLSPEYDDSDWDYLNIVGDIRLEGKWNASMFYNPDPDTKRFYRYKFNLADNPKGALVNINGDNKVKFWVNGKELTPGKHAESWSVFDTHDITSLLNKGGNVIAVEETNHLGYGWMVFQGLVHLYNGEKVEILSNSHWKESETFSPDWQNIGFDDALWESPVLADAKVSSFNFLRMRRPNKILFSKSSVWWRIAVVPNAKYLVLPGLADGTEIWVDGKKVSTNSEKVMLSDNARMIVIKIGEDATGLSQPAAFYCDGWSETNLVSWLDMGLRRFTGFIDYETNFTLPSNTSSFTIDLGNVRYMAEVWLNEKKIGERLWPPFIFTGKTNKAGENKIRVRVGNLMVNEMGGKDDLGKLRTWGWQTPPDSSFDAGLLGPVKIGFISAVKNK